MHDHWFLDDNKNFLMKNSSIVIAKHVNFKTRQQIRKIIELKIKHEDNFLKLNNQKYRNIIVDIQDELNDKEYTTKIVDDIKFEIFKYLKTKSFLVQSNLYLRATRPIKEGIINKGINTESIGFHRESFYGSNMEKSINIWTPIKGVNHKNTLRYIPESHLINEKYIKVKNIKNKSVSKFSPGHKLGFQYSPKKIIGGVDLTNQKKMNVKLGYSSIFSGNLIHGAAVNNSKKIRFSCDFRIIRKRDYSTKNKDFHFASGKPYFLDFKI